MKQFVQKGHNYGPTTLGFCITIMHRLTPALVLSSFESIDEIKAESKKALMAVPEKDQLACFENWKIRWYKCISSRGDYFEGHKIDLKE